MNVPSEQAVSKNEPTVDWPLGTGRTGCVLIGREMNNSLGNLSHPKGQSDQESPLTDIPEAF